jgi:hypothetical protein
VTYTLETLIAFHRGRLRQYRSIGMDRRSSAVARHRWLLARLIRLRRAHRRMMRASAELSADVCVRVHGDGCGVPECDVAPVYETEDGPRCYGHRNVGEVQR